MDDDIGIIKQQRKKEEREFKMYGIQKSTSINGFISSLPKIVAKKIWKVTDSNGTVVQYVSATNNLKRTAQQYIDQKYPGQVMKLTFSHTKGLITVAR